MAVFATTTMFAPARAALKAIAKPMPLEAPVMNNVLPFNDKSLIAHKLHDCKWKGGQFIGGMKRRVVNRTQSRKSLDSYLSGSK